MLHRIRKAMQNGSMLKMGGPGSSGVEVDETFIGGKARNMHICKRRAFHWHLSRAEQYQASGAE